MIDIDDPLFLATEMQRAREGKMSPQEKSKYIEAAYHFDVEEKPVAPPVQILIQQVFADGEKDERLVTIEGKR